MVSMSDLADDERVQVNGAEFPKRVAVEVDGIVCIYSIEAS